MDFAAALYQLLRDGLAAQEHAEAAITLASEHEYILWLVQGKVLRGWALAEQGQSKEGIAQIREGLSAWRATGAELGRPYYLALLAEASTKIAQSEAALSALAEALGMIYKYGERYREAEVYRFKGELLLAYFPGDHTEAQACFEQALEIARRQEAKALLDELS